MTDDDTTKLFERAWRKKIEDELADVKEIVAALCAEVFGDDEEFKATSNAEDVEAEIEDEDDSESEVSPEDIDVIFYGIGDGAVCKLRISGDGKPFIVVEDDESSETFDLVDFLANFSVTEAREALLRVLGQAIIISAQAATADDASEEEGPDRGD